MVPFFNAEQMETGRDKTQQLILPTLNKELNRVNLACILSPDGFKGLDVEGQDLPIDKGPQMKVAFSIHKVDLVGRGKGSIPVSVIQRIRRKKVGEEGQHSQHQDHQTAGDSCLALFEFFPD